MAGDEQGHAMTEMSRREFALTVGTALAVLAIPCPAASAPSLTRAGWRITRIGTAELRVFSDGVPFWTLAGGWRYESPQAIPEVETWSMRPWSAWELQAISEWYGPGAA